MKKSVQLAAIVVGVIVTATSCFSARLTTKETIVRMETTQGIIEIKLYNETPLHRDNFVKLVENKFYDGVLFHRVIADFMIQGGDPNSRTAKLGERLGTGDTGYTIPAEIRTPAIYHKRGALAAARQGDHTNPQKASSGCQFYIVQGKKFSDNELDHLQKRRSAVNNHTTGDSTYIYRAQALHDYKTIGGTPHLDGNYTVFGEVIKGLELIEKISEVQTDASDRPLEDVRILKMSIAKQ